ncbi:MAG TPA: hypothetical protein VM598_07235 [Bdellovibrionota bacterium]|nr:hypothetical protein [Bdellovibrionota bacterium]
MPAGARAELGLITYGGRGFSAAVTAGGHSAIYFSKICPDGPLKLRKCRPEDNEHGSVIGRYSSWGQHDDGTKVRNDWAVVPLVAHLYGVESREQIPLIFTNEIAAAVRERYRARHFDGLIRPPREGERESPGQWQNMLAISFVRGIDILVLETTDEEDELLIESYNRDDNTKKFNFLLENCADFSRKALQKLFPETGRRWSWRGVLRLIKNFGMTAPLSVLKGYADYGRNHPERLMRYATVQQHPGTHRYDGPVRDGVDNAYKKPQYLLPLLMAPNYLIGFTVASLFDRFDKDKERAKYPNVEIARLRLKQAELEATGPSPALKTELESLKAEILMKIAQEWSKDDEAFESYRSRFAALVTEALESGAIDGRDAWLLRNEDPQKYLKLFEGKRARARFDEGRGLLLEIRGLDGVTRVAGASYDNIEREDPKLGLQLALGALNYMLDVKRKDRPELADVERAWGAAERLARTLSIR